MNIGFTGTQHGMTIAQKSSLWSVLDRIGSSTIEIVQFHHGCCIGADEESARMAKLAGFFVVGHPPEDRAKIWEEHISIDNDIRPPLPYLDRNHVIVDETSQLIAAPRLLFAELRSGTWSTIRYAKKIHRVVTVVWPTGSVVEYSSTGAERKVF